MSHTVTKPDIIIQILLNLARSIFEEQNNLECLVTKIMTEARDLLKCERCAVFLVDSNCGEQVKVSSTQVIQFERFTLLKILFERVVAEWLRRWTLDSKLLYISLFVRSLLE